MSVLFPHWSRTGEARFKEMKEREIETIIYFRGALPINTRAAYRNGGAALLCAGTERIGSLHAYAEMKQLRGIVHLERHFLLHLRLTGTLHVDWNESIALRWETLGAFR
jgi:hypothetical protein